MVAGSSGLAQRALAVAFFIPLALWAIAWYVPRALDAGVRRGEVIPKNATETALLASRLRRVATWLFIVPLALATGLLLSRIT